MTVITKEQMQDFAMLDVNDIFIHTASAEGTGTFTALSVDRNGSVADSHLRFVATMSRVAFQADINSVKQSNGYTVKQLKAEPLRLTA